MGCFPSKSIKEVVICEKEKELMIANFAITEIKEAFFVLNFKDEISMDNILKGFRFLNVQFSDAQKTSILLPFLKGFTKQTIFVGDDHEYCFRDIMAIFFLLSKKNIDREKSDAIFRLYDMGNDGTLGQKEITYMLRKLLSSVNDYSAELLRKNEELRNQIKEMEKQVKFEKKLGEVLENCQTILNVNEEHKLTEKKFYKRLVSLKANFGYDFLSTAGIRQILDDKLQKE